MTTVERAPPARTPRRSPARVRLDRSPAELQVLLGSLLSQLPVDDPKKRQTMLEEFARRLSAGELEGLLRSADLPAGTPDALDLRNALLGRLARLRPHAAVEMASALSDASERTRALRVVAEQWAATDALEASQWLLVQDDVSLRELVAPLIVAQLEARHPREAADFAAALPAGTTQADLLGRLLATWRSTDFDGALGWAVDLADGPGKELALIHLSYRWMDTDPAGALAYALDHPTANTRLLNVVVTQWAAREPAVAAAWAAQLPPGDDRTRVLTSLTAAWAQTMPVEAARFAATLSDEGARNQAVISAISGWARQDPQAALSWATQFPPGALQEQAYTQVLFAWTQSDALAASEWLARLPDGAVRDTAFSTFSGSIVERFPSIALAFAENIANESERLARIENIARRWLAIDRETASAALERSTVPVEMISRLLRPHRAGRTSAAPAGRR